MFLLCSDHLMWLRTWESPLNLTSHVGHVKSSSTSSRQLSRGLVMVTSSAPSGCSNGSYAYTTCRTHYVRLSYASRTPPCCGCQPCGSPRAKLHTHSTRTTCVRKWGRHGRHFVRSDYVCCTQSLRPTNAVRMSYAITYMRCRQLIALPKVRSGRLHTHAVR